MMGRQSGQISMLVLDMEELIPENHLLRRMRMAVHLSILSVCLKCCWWDTYTVSSQSVGLSKKSS